VKLSVVMNTRWTHAPPVEPFVSSSSELVDAVEPLASTPVEVAPASSLETSPELDVPVPAVVFVEVDAAAVSEPAEPSPDPPSPSAKHAATDIHATAVDRQRLTTDMLR
jgi:hypothetical protein